MSLAYKNKQIALIASLYFITLGLLAWSTLPTLYGETTEKDA